MGNAKNEKIYINYQKNPKIIRNTKVEFLVLAVFVAIINSRAVKKPK